MGCTPILTMAPEQRLPGYVSIMTVSQLTGFMYARNLTEECHELLKLLEVDKTKELRLSSIETQNKSWCFIRKLGPSFASLLHIQDLSRDGDSVPWTSSEVEHTDSRFTVANSSTTNRRSSRMNVAASSHLWLSLMNSNAVTRLCDRRRRQPDAATGPAWWVRQAQYHRTSSGRCCWMQSQLPTALGASCAQAYWLTCMPFSVLSIVCVCLSSRSLQTLIKI